MNSTRHSKLLIVDDNPADIALACEALAGCAYDGQISSVNDGEEAIAFLTGGQKYAGAGRPDLVILDLNLPKKDGRAVLAELKANPELRPIPVVIFSTSRLGRDVAASYELGANCYVTKPGNLNEYFSAMRAIEKFWFGAASLPSRGE
ncbi:MAG TPA: response regulator [Candidatus Binatia bacterium]|nr:response regulator [Candidatus Binatia bacterium]